MYKQDWNIIPPCNVKIRMKQCNNNEWNDDDYDDYGRGDTAENGVQNG